ncbi:MAG: DNA-binding protein [Sphingobacteriales bacterium 41-5]|nr:MAG: DNA-binding protein [Sphingobacteriales bacterium 41-5]
MADSWNKKDREQRKRNAKKQKAEKKLERKENTSKGKSLDDMIAYVDENGNLSSTPPDPKARNTDNIPPVVANSNELNPENNQRQGIITFFDATKGYGFIRDTKTQESIFVHINSSNVQLENNLRVTFEVEKGPKGLAAINVSSGN